MRKIRFTIVEDDGKEYMITNYRHYKGKIIFATNGRCWKFEVKKRAK